MLDKYREIIAKVAKEVWENLSESDQQEVLQSEVYEMHFGLGLNIRNTYVYGKTPKLTEQEREQIWEPDSFSSAVLRYIKHELNNVPKKELTKLEQAEFDKIMSKIIL